MAHGVFFPTPRYFGPVRRWALSELIAYEHALAGKPPPESTEPADERWLSATQVQQRYNVSSMWLWRRHQETKCAAEQEAADARAA